MGSLQRHLPECLHIDANRINARGHLTHMNQLEAWHEQGVIQIEMAHPAQQEAACGSGDRARKTYGYVYNMAMATTPQERVLLSKIEEILFPAGVSNTNEKNGSQYPTPPSTKM